MKNVKFSRNGVEFEPTKQELKIVLDDFAKQLGERDKRIADLERQIAEKDTQIQSQKKNLEFFYDVFNNSESYQTFSDINQANTDFAIEQLKQVRKWCYDIGEWTRSKYHRVLSLKALDEFINKQIHELKGEENV